ncbi:MAG: NADH-quinone oxidoreductase subunit NuoE [Paracoccaceae bacterium]
MLRRLHKEQPSSFAFTPANQAWAEAQMNKFPSGRQASAVIPLLWRAQEQEGWLSRPAIEGVADMLGLAYMRVLEVATFYFMFQLQPVGSVAHVQVCGTTSCMICGAEDLISVCRAEIAPNAHDISADGKFSWEEVECLGACANAPMVQVGKDYYEDLTAEKFREVLAAFGRGEVPKPGPQNGRFSCEPAGGRTTLTELSGEAHNGSVARALSLGDTVKRIQGDEVPLLKRKAPANKATSPKADAKAETAAPVTKAKPAPKAAPKAGPEPANVSATVDDGAKPATLAAARETGADDLKRISGIGPKLEKMLNGMGFYHFDQLAAWSETELAWVDQNLDGFKGRASRDEWVAQAKVLAQE